MTPSIENPFRLLKIAVAAILLLASAAAALVAGRHYAAAAEAYLDRARDERGRPEAVLRRAGLLAGPLQQPEAAAAELDALRSASGLAPDDDIRVGLALAELKATPFAAP